MDNNCADFEVFEKKIKHKNKMRPERVNNARSDDLPAMFTDLCGNVNYKIAFFLFILGVIIFSDVFIELFLVPIKGAVYGDVPTNTGTTIQLLLLTLGYIIIDLLNTGNII